MTYGPESNTKHTFFFDSTKVKITAVTLYDNGSTTGTLIKDEEVVTGKAFYTKGSTGNAGKITATITATTGTPSVFKDSTPGT